MPKTTNKISKIKIATMPSLLACLLTLFASMQHAVAQDSPKESTVKKESERNFLWTEVEKGFSLAKYTLRNRSSVITSQVLLARFDPKLFSFHAISPKSLSNTPSDSVVTADARTITRRMRGVAGINANFFDSAGKALGLVVDNFKLKQRLHKTGRTMTGVFFISNDVPKILSRDGFDENSDIETGVQAGPRLILNGKPIEIGADQSTSRRSGVAITRAQQIILYATMLRFPGASLIDIQSMLLDPALEIRDALNFDGGGSSQLYLAPNSASSEETFITGGDEVPVILVVKRKE